MNEFFRRVGDTVRAAWTGMTPAQRTALFLLVAAVITIFTWTVRTATAPTERLLAGPDKPAEIRRQIAEQLKTKNIPYVLKNEGVYVAPEDYEKANLELAEAGLFSDKEISRWLFEADMISTRWEKDKRWQVTRERRLAQSLAQLSSIERAEVSLTPPTQQFFSMGDKAGRATASVILHPRGGQKIGSKTALTVAMIVARAAGGGMQREDVTVTDAATGLMISVPAASEQMYENYEQNTLEHEEAERIKNEVREALQSQFPNLQVLARVKFNAEDKNTQRRLSEEGGADAIPIETIKETESRMPLGYDPTPLAKGNLLTPPLSAGPPDKRDRSERRLFPNVSRTETQTRLARGAQLEYVSISVMIPQELFRRKDAQGNLVDMPDPQRQQIETQVKTLVMGGFKFGDPNKIDVTVGSLPTFAAPAIALPRSLWERIESHLSATGGTYATGLLFLLSIGLLWFLYRMVRAALERKPGEEVRAELTAAAAEGPEFSQWQEAEAVAENLRGQIRDMVQKNPRAVAGVLRRWMGQKS
jgi:flagellar biosynthesis/type III secretory pathway M-ring protein FliF/YscJ